MSKADGEERMDSVLNTASGVRLPDAALKS